jgi:CheY-like chemotaxis protein
MVPSHLVATMAYPRGVGNSSAPRAAALIDALLILSRSLPDASAEGALSDTLDIVLAGAASSQGAAFAVAGAALDLVGGRGLTPGLRGVLQRLPLTGAPWFVAQRAAESRRLVMDRVIAQAVRAPFAEARWEHTVACPVAAGGEVFGVIVVAWPDIEQPDERVLGTIEIACHMTALEMARLGALRERRAPRSSRPGDAPPTPLDASRSAPTVPEMPAVKRASRAPVLHAEMEERASGAPQSLRQEQLSALSRAVADALRREGPQPGALMIAELRRLGVSEQEAVAALTFALSTGAVVRDPPPSTVLHANEANEPRTVLIVDDDHDLRQTLSEILRDEGYAVETAVNGREALDLMRGRSAPRVLVLDLMMPVMDGWQLLDELRRDEALSRIPVVVISASNRGPRATGAAEILQKPLDYYKLVTSVERSASRATPT